MRLRATKLRDRVSESGLRFVASGAARHDRSLVGTPPRFIQLHHADDQSPREEIIAGLAMPMARVAPKFFYDALGSHLFDAITRLDEYYPTRTEAAIVDTHLAEIAECVGRGCTLIDLGAGDGRKAARLFDKLAPSAYAAIDISAEYLRSAVESLQRQYPRIRMLGVGTDFSSSLVLPEEIRAERRVFFYPGSSIGNFTRTDAARFLARVREACSADGALLIGVDLVKDTATLERAYDDALGVTAAFNLNMLRHLNRIAGTDFRVEQWRHVARYDEIERRIEMLLEARESLQVRWAGGERSFARGERIHTEYSHKYTPDRFAALAAEAGWQLDRYWTDPRTWFGVFLFRPT